MRFRVLTLALGFLLAGCDPGPNVNEFNYKPEVNVFALLLLNSDQVIVRLENTYRALDSVPADRGIADATVVISAKDQQVSFVHHGEGLYAERSERLHLAPGTIYQLVIQLADGRRVEGECTMPAPPLINSPAEQQQVPAYSSLSVSWHSEAPAPRYAVSVRGNINGYHAEAYTDSLQMAFYPFYLAQPDIYILKVAAMDRNYYDYLRLSEDDVPVWHIRGGIGVFGAIASAQRVIIAQ